MWVVSAKFSRCARVNFVHREFFYIFPPEAWQFEHCWGTKLTSSKFPTASTFHFVSHSLLKSYIQGAKQLRLFGVPPTPCPHLPPARKRPLALARAVDGAVREASLLPRCQWGLLARFRVSPSVSVVPSPQSLMALLFAPLNGRQPTAVHASLSARLTGRPLDLNIFNGARGTP